MVRPATPIGPAMDNDEQAVLSHVLLNVQDFNFESARSELKLFRYGEPRTAMAFEARRHLTSGLVLALEGDPTATEAIDTGTSIARAQKAHLWTLYGSTLRVLADSDSDPSLAVAQLGRDNSVVLSMLAEIALARMKDMDVRAVESLIGEAEIRPWRWRKAVRRLLQSPNTGDRGAAAVLLQSIGEIEDVKRLRDAGRLMRDRRSPRLGLELARRLADRVAVEDLGRVTISVGSRAIEGGLIRRKVLALLCLLLSKSRFASTREEVVDSLWPDLDPSAALNSLNQTVYFLRRVFEPSYDEDTSPGYVGQDGETIWLDSELIDGRSRRCLEIIRGTTGQPTPEAAIALAHAYRGKFALDFAYEEWSSAYRDALHAGYLRVMEHAIRIDIDTGHFERGTFLAERALEVDPESEEIQAALVRLYRLSGAHAAAAEQYAHYSQTMRGLGVEPASYIDV
jgi:DNA-binding SARP family transcriptional activator